MSSAAALGDAAKEREMRAYDEKRDLVGVGAEVGLDGAAGEDQKLRSSRSQWFGKGEGGETQKVGPRLR